MSDQPYLAQAYNPNPAPLHQPHSDASRQRPSTNSHSGEMPSIYPTRASSDQLVSTHSNPYVNQPRPLSKASSNASIGSHSRPLSIRDVDLNASQYSIASSTSMRLGGVDYPVGSRIGSSGLFVIGPPIEPKGNRNGLNTSMSQASTVSSKKPLTPQKTYGYVSRGYSFEDWNWSSIRFSLFIVVIAVMIGLLAATIGLSVRVKEKCVSGFEWWQGPVVYRIPVGLFMDYTTDNNGDLSGLEYSKSYLQSLGVKTLMLSYVLPHNNPEWASFTSFQGVDTRVGTPEQMEKIVADFKKYGIHIMLELEIAITSINHQWFVDSKYTSVKVGGKFENFYTWRNQPDPSTIDGSWTLSPVRNQYYFHPFNPYKAWVNWSDPGVLDEMASDLEYWLEMGIDGFYIRDLSKLHIPSTATYDAILDRFRQVLDDYSRVERKILVVDDYFINELMPESPITYQKAMDSVDLIRVPVKYEAINRTVVLKGEIEAGLKWQKTIGNPWVMWTLENPMSTEQTFLAALQLFMLTMPGTPCIVAAEEVQRFLLEENEPAPLMWSQTGAPYNPGSILDPEYPISLGNIISARNVEFSLRKDNLKFDGPVKDFNLNFLFLDKYTVLLERWYGHSDGFLYLVNLSDRAFERDWSSFSPYGSIVATTHSGREDTKVQLKHVRLQPGEALILRIKK